MNERIRELAEQADKWSAEEYHQLFLANESPDRQKLFKEKFAELIVGECMRMCDVAAIGYESHNHFKEANGCYSAKEYIEEHFGVEE
jgi:hypothetical protein